MRSVDVGYQPTQVTTASYSLPQKQYEKQTQIDTFNRELLRRLNELPGVTTTALTSLLPAGNNNNNQTFVVEGYAPPKGADMNLATASQVMGKFARRWGFHCFEDASLLSRTGMVPTGVDCESQTGAAFLARSAPRGQTASYRDA